MAAAEFRYRLSFFFANSTWLVRATAPTRESHFHTCFPAVLSGLDIASGGGNVQSLSALA